MTKFQRKIVAVVLAMTMIFSMLSTVFAVDNSTTYEQSANTLKGYGVFVGDGQGNLMLDQQLKRQDAVIISLRLMGLEDEEFLNYENLSDFTDIQDEYYKPIIGMAQDMGLVEGMGDGTFGFNQLITAQQLETLLLRALGYEVTDEMYPNVNQLAQQVGILSQIEVAKEVAITRDIVAQMMLNTLNTNVKDEDQKLGEKLGFMEEQQAVAPVLSDVKSNETSTSADKVTISGKVTPATATVKVAGQAATVAADGTFQAEATIDKAAANGLNNIVVEATNDGKTDSKTVAVTYVVGFAVASVSPADKTTEVSADTNILINLNKDADSATVVNSAIQVKEKSTGTVAAGVASYDRANKQVKFDITGALKNSAEYTVTVKNIIKDSEGNALAADYVFGFTTSNAPVVQSQDPGEGTAWSDTDVQVVFNKAMDGSTLTTGTVKMLNLTDNEYIPGTVTLAADGKTLTFTASAADLELNKTYNLVIGSAAKDLNGVQVAGEIKKAFVRATAPGLVTASTRVSNIATPFNDVYPKITAEGGNASFRILLQFDTDMDPATINTSTITLRDIDTGKDVAIDITYDAGSRYATIVPKADLKDDGNYQVRFDETNIKGATGLKAGSITDISFDTGDFTRPTVASSTPAQGDSDIKTDAQIKVLVSEKLTAAKVEGAARFTTAAQAADYNTNTAVYRLKNESTGNWVDMTATGLDFSASFSVAEKSITFSHASALADNTTYTLYIRGEVSGAASNIIDENSNALKDEYKVTFTTAAADETAPRIVSVKWNDADLKDQYGIDTTKKIKVTFDEPVQAPATDTDAGTLVFTWTDEGTLGADASTHSHFSDATLEDNGKTVVVTVPAALVNGTDGADSKWRLTIAGIRDLASTPNSMDSKYYEFYSGPRPTVDKFHASTVPAPYAVSVPVANNITINFSDTGLGIDTNTINTTNVKVINSTTKAVVDAAISYAAGVATINPTNNLDSNTFYTVVVSGVKDQGGNAVEDTSYTFKTADTSAPTIAEVTPANGSMGQATDINLTIKFAQAMAPATIIADTGNIELVRIASGVETAIPFELTYDTTTNTATLNPTSYLAMLSAYRIKVGTDVLGLNGVALAEAKNYDFGTGAGATQGKITNVVWNDGGTAGLVEAGETITIFFDVPLRANQADGQADAIALSDITVDQGNIGGAGAAISYTAGNKYATITLGAAPSISIGATTFAPAINSLYDLNSTAFSTIAKAISKN